MTTAAWPDLPLDGWRATYDTLHLWSQIVGKTRLALAPMQNHWWQVALRVTSRGMGGAPLPVGHRTLDIDFDFVDHVPYDAVRTAPDPDRALLEFLQSTYDAAADLAGWDRGALDRRT
jgi:hypothetical protein